MAFLHTVEAFGNVGPCEPSVGSGLVTQQQFVLEPNVTAVVF